MPRKPDALMLASFEAEQKAIEHVRWMRSQGMSLAEVAYAVGLTKHASWDEVTMRLALAQYQHEARRIFEQWAHEADSSGYVG